MTTPATSFLAKASFNAVVIAGAVIALAVCVAGPWEVGQAARRTQDREACEAVQLLTQGLSASMRSTAASMREFEQENRRIAATWRATGAAIPERHSSGDDVLLQMDASIAASNERTADEEEQFANETDRHAADIDAQVASRCERDGL